MLFQILPFCLRDILADMTECSPGGFRAESKTVLGKAQSPRVEACFRTLSVSLLDVTVTRLSEIISPD